MSLLSHVNADLRDRIYDAVRQHLSLGIPPASVTIESLATWGVRVVPDNDADMDAFYSAMYDLQAEGMIAASSGTPAERTFGSGLSPVSRDDVVPRYPELASLAHFSEESTLFERLQIVDGSPWAFTVSVFPFPVATFARPRTALADSHVSVDVFEVLREAGHAPAEVFGTVRTADGSVVKPYRNAMRSDRYVFRVRESIVSRA